MRNGKEAALKCRITHTQSVTGLVYDRLPHLRAKPDISVSLGWVEAFLSFHLAVQRTLRWFFACGPLPHPHQTCLAPQSEALNELTVAVVILSLEVIQQTSALTDNPEQSAARMMVLLMRFKMGRELL